MRYEKLEAQVREERGSRAVRSLRRTGVVPGVVYGGKAEDGSPRRDSHAVSIDYKTLERFIYKGVKFYDLTLSGEETHTVLKDIQWDAIDDRILHVDLERIALNEPVVVAVPVQYKGVSKGEKAGGRLRKLLSVLHVRGLPRELPEAIVCRLDNLEANSTMKVGEIEMPEGVECVTQKEIPAAEVKLKVAKAAKAEKA